MEHVVSATGLVNYNVEMNIWADSFKTLSLFAVTCCVVTIIVWPWFMSANVPARGMFDISIVFFLVVGHHV
jgi:hypothetical protein